MITKEDLREAYADGHDAGREVGYAEGLEAAKPEEQIVDRTLAGHVPQWWADPFTYGRHPK